MAVEPKIIKNRSAAMRQCTRCGLHSPADDFAVTHSAFYPDGRLPICNSCVNELLAEHSFSWDFLDKVCQWADIPWIVKEWTRLADMNGEEHTWPVYAQVFADSCYSNLGWKDYDAQYRKLREVGLIEEEIPLVRDKKWEDLSRKWGANYDNTELAYLEDLYKGLLATQNVNGALQIDQAQKICKLSLEIDSRIRAGDKDVDKFLSSYDKLVKTAEFTPKNIKNAADFDSFAEVAVWLEKRGRQNNFYDNVTRDVIDETLKNIENYNQRLYINEGGIGEEISERLKSLQHANDLEEENFYGIKTEMNLDEYDNEGFTVDEEEDFKASEADDDE